MIPITGSTVTNSGISYDGSYFIVFYSLLIFALLFFVFWQLEKKKSMELEIKLKEQVFLHKKFE